MVSLNKKTRNYIYVALSSGGLEPAQCELKGIDQSGLTVTHRPSGSVINLIQATSVGAGHGDIGGWNGLIINTKVGYDSYHETTISNSIQRVSAAITQWAKGVRNWVDTPDLWELSRSAAAIPGELILDSDNTPFASDEQATISTQLKDIVASVKKTYQLTAEQSAELDKKFEQAEKASRRMGRKDWGLLFGGAVFSLILADVITPGIAGHILMMIEHGIGHLFSGPGGTLSAG